MNRTEAAFVGRVVALLDSGALPRRLVVQALLPGFVFLATFLGSVWLAVDTGSPMVSLSIESLLPGSKMSAWEIFRNNARVLGAIVVGGVLTFTIGAILLLLINALHFGGSLGFLLGSYGPATATAAFLPHGVFEVAAFVVGASVSVRVTVLWARRHVPDRQSDPLHVTVLDLLGRVVLAFALLWVAAVIETSVTPTVVQMV